MKPYFIDKSNLSNRSFSFEYHSLPHYLKVWHYHPELELLIQKKSTGTRFIGDNISKFESGEVVLVGKNLPHMWLNDDSYFNHKSSLCAEAHVIHFREDFAGAGFFKIPEMSSINELLKRSAQGINFLGESKAVIHQMVESLSSASDFDKIFELAKILKMLSEETNYELLSSEGFLTDFEKSDKRQLDEVYHYVMQNFQNEIKLKQIAEIVNMTASSFSRYFKRVNGKTFSQYVSEIRIGYACRLLIENEYQISRVCFESGFTNLSNFNRQFKSIMNYSPSEYLKMHASVRHSVN
ncbi:MAG: AraC-like DNA-binding protein [Cyclobacteriaceae bacterium]|jgi:AraC-like DNA-binding protein